MPNSMKRGVYGGSKSNVIKKDEAKEMGAANIHQTCYLQEASWGKARISQ